MIIGRKNASSTHCFDFYCSEKTLTLFSVDSELNRMSDLTILTGWQWSLNGIPVKSRITIKSMALIFLEAATVFDDPLSITYPDPDHSRDEERFIIIGQSKLGRLLIVAHMDRADGTRIISDRAVTNRERKLYGSES